MPGRSARRAAPWGCPAPPRRARAPSRCPTAAVASASSAQCLGDGRAGAVDDRAREDARGRCPCAPPRSRLAAHQEHLCAPGGEASWRAPGSARAASAWWAIRRRRGAPPAAVRDHVPAAASRRSASALAAPSTTRLPGRAGGEPERGGEPLEAPREDDLERAHRGDVGEEEPLGPPAEPDPHPGARAEEEPGGAYRAHRREGDVEGSGPELPGARPRTEVRADIGPVERTASTAGAYRSTSAPWSWLSDHQLGGRGSRRAGRRGGAGRRRRRRCHPSGRRGSADGLVVPSRAPVALGCAPRMRPTPLRCSSCSLTSLAAAPPATPDEARAFVKTVNEELKALAVKQSTADWIKSTYITEDTERASAWAERRHCWPTPVRRWSRPSASTGSRSTRTRRG